MAYTRRRQTTRNVKSTGVFRGRWSPRIRKTRHNIFILSFSIPVEANFVINYETTLPCINEIQRLYFGSVASPIVYSLESGSYTISYDGETTATLYHSDSAATVQAALEALTNIGSGNILVTATANGYLLEFVQALTSVNLPLSTATNIDLKERADTISVNTTTSGSPPIEAAGTNYTITSNVTRVYEIQVIHLGGATTGTFDITFSDTAGTQTVSSLDYLGITSAVSALSSALMVSDLGGGDYRVDFGYPYDGAVSGLYVSSNSTDGSPWVEVVQDGVSGVSQVDLCYFSPGSPTSGYMYFDGQYLDYSTDASSLFIAGGAATASGSPYSGSIYTYWSDYDYHSPLSISTSSTLFYATGQNQVVTVDLTDEPTEGTLEIVLDGSSSGTINYNNTTPSIIGWTLNSGATNHWTFTNDTQESDTYCYASEVSNLMRAVGVEIGAVQDGLCIGTEIEVTADHIVNLEYLLNTSINNILNVEYALSVQSNSTLNFESLQGISSDYSVNMEGLLLITKDQIANLEHLISMVKDNAANLEYLKTVKAYTGITINSDFVDGIDGSPARFHLAFENWMEDPQGSDYVDLWFDVYAEDGTTVEDSILVNVPVFDDGYSGVDGQQDNIHGTFISNINSTFGSTVVTESSEGDTDSNGTNLFVKFQFTGSLASRRIELSIDGWSSDDGGAPFIDESWPGEAGTYAVQTLTFTPPATSGSWTLNGDTKAYDWGFDEVDDYYVTNGGSAATGTIVLTRTISGSGASPKSYSAGTLNGGQINTEYVTSISKDNAANVEFLTTVKQDGSITLEWLSGIAGDSSVLVEYIATIATDSSINLEVIGSISGDSVVNIENLLNLVSDSTNGIEYTLNVSADGSINVEWTGGITTDLQFINVEYLTALVANSDINIEYSINIGANSQFNLEYLLGLVADNQANTEHVLSFTKDDIINFESLTMISSEQASSIEHLLGVLSDNTENLEYLVKISSDGVVTVEWLGTEAAVTSDSEINFEFIATIASDGTVTTESLLGISNDNVSNIEHLLSIANNYAANVEYLLTINGDKELNTEYTLSFDKNDTINFEYLTMISSDQISGLEYLLGVFSDNSENIEYLVTINSDGLVNVEWNGVVGVTYDAQIPFEFLANVASDGQITVEGVLGVAKENAVNTENLLAISEDKVVHTENLLGLSNDYSIPLEFLISVGAIDSTVIVEYLSTLNVDEEVKLEYLTSISSALATNIEYYANLSVDHLLNLEHIQDFESVNFTVNLELLSLIEQNSILNLEYTQPVFALYPLLKWILQNRKRVYIYNEDRHKLWSFNTRESRHWTSDGRNRLWTFLDSTRQRIWPLPI